MNNFGGIQANKTKEFRYKFLQSLDTRFSKDPNKSFEIFCKIMSCLSMPRKRSKLFKKIDFRINQQTTI